MQSERRLALPTNHHVAEGILPAVEGRHPAARTWCHQFLRVYCFDAFSAGLEAPALRQAGCLPPQFRGSKRENGFRDTLTLTLSPRRGNRQWPRRKNSLNGEPVPALEKVLPLPGGEGRGEGELEFQLNTWLRE